MNLRLYGGWSFRRAFRDYGWAVAALFAVLWLLVAAYVVNPIEEAVDPVVNLIRSPDAVRCLEGWTQTRGVDPDTQAKFLSCTDGRIIVTVRENQTPVGLNQATGRFLTAEETAGFIK